MRVTINKYPISTKFGAVDLTHATPHKGVDFAMPQGAPVEAVGNGTITALTDEGSKSFGKAVHLHLDNGVDVIYGHLSAFQCKVGQHVQTGDTVGLVGCTGNSYGPHLHLQASIAGKLIDPTPLVTGNWFSGAGDWLRRTFPNGAVGGESHQGSVWVWLWNKYVVTPCMQLDALADSGALDWPVCIGCMAGIMLWMVGMRWHMKYVFWAFLGYLALRGFFSGV